VFQCVFEVDHQKGLTLTEISEGETVDKIKAATGCQFNVSTCTNISPIFNSVQFNCIIRKEIAL
jgi:acyl CoA:acetate/3-ketoacid CoA transferase beta subunit